MGADVVVDGVVMFLSQGIQLATLLALLSGVLAKVWVGWLHAKVQDPKAVFDVQYLITALLTTFIGASTIVQAAPQAPTSLIATASYLSFIFGAGYGINEALNRATVDKAYADGVKDGAPK